MNIKTICNWSYVFSIFAAFVAIVSMGLTWLASDPADKSNYSGLALTCWILVACGLTVYAIANRIWQNRLYEHQRLFQVGEKTKATLKEGLPEGHPWR